MAACTFFGHRDTPSEIMPVLESRLRRMIESEGVDLFYIGNQGAFDKMARKILKNLKNEYPHIRYSVVLAYMPQKAERNEDFEDTVFPDGLESIPRKHAIYERNMWMIKNSEHVITYVRYGAGGAKTFKTVAEKAGKQVYNLFLPS